jgi:hypothetical protein
MTEVMSQRESNISREIAKDRLLAEVTSQYVGWNARAQRQFGDVRAYHMKMGDALVSAGQHWPRGQRRQSCKEIVNRQITGIELTAELAQQLGVRTPVDGVLTHEHRRLTEQDRWQNGAAAIAVLGPVQEPFSNRANREREDDRRAEERN